MEAHISSRLADISDIEFITSLTKEMASLGHFNPHIVNNISTCYYSFLMALSSGNYPYAYSPKAKIVPHPNNKVEFRNFIHCPSNIDIVLLNHKPAGFQLWFSLPTEQGLFVEYHLLAIKNNPSVRNHGCARHLVKRALKCMPKNATIIARCLKSSNIMLDYFQRLGFEIDEHTEETQQRIARLPPEKRDIALKYLDSSM